jgi:putative ABC transport system permease protein
LSAEERTRKDLTWQNAVDIATRCPSVQDVSPMLFGPDEILNAHYKANDMYDINLMGVEEAYARGGQVDMHLGRFFTEEESRRKTPVAVIGADVEKGLYANVNPIGKTVTVDGHQLEVIGTMIRPAASFFGDQDMRILIPYGMMQKMYPNARENAIVVTAKDGQLPRALDEVRTILRIDRRVPYDKPDNFALSTADQMVADFRQITAITFLVMAVLSSIGLLVGGIGVMNIMLVSVTERTQEIGVRKAIGARRRDIILQFLLEASVLTSLGGVAGILFGWIISLISRMVFTSLPAQVPMWAAVLGIVVSGERRAVLRDLAGLSRRHSSIQWRRCGMSRSQAPPRAPATAVRRLRIWFITSEARKGLRSTGKLCSSHNASSSGGRMVPVIMMTSMRGWFLRNSTPNSTPLPSGSM